MRSLVAFGCRAVGTVSILVFAMWWLLPMLTDWSTTFALPVMFMVAGWALAAWWWLVPFGVWPPEGDPHPPVILGVEPDEPDSVEPEETPPTGQWRVLHSPSRPTEQR